MILVLLLFFWFKLVVSFNNATVSGALLAVLVVRLLMMLYFDVRRVMGWLVWFVDCVLLLMDFALLIVCCRIVWGIVWLCCYWL